MKPFYVYNYAEHVGLDKNFVVSALQKLDFCRVWERGFLKRLYFNNLPELYGLEISRYKTNNISSATMDGDDISNSAAQRHLMVLSGRFFYDCHIGAFVSYDIPFDYCAVLVHRILNAAQLPHYNDEDGG